MTDTTHRPGTVHALLADGSTVEIRPARPQDLDEVLRMHREMSPEALRLRFFAANPRYTRAAAERICAPAHPGYQALVAVAESRVIGVAEYDTLPAAPGEPVSADLALAVAEGRHGQGIGTLLLEHLVHAAREAGVSAFTAEALAENHEVLKVFGDLGLRTSRHFDGTDVRCTVHLEEDEDYLAAVDRRGRIADVASLRPLLRPRSVAVVGAGRRPGSVGRAVLGNVRSGGFAGALYAVNPHARVIEGTPAFPSVATLPLVPELAVLAVPAPAVPGVAEECGAVGVRALVVLTAGLDAGQAEALFTCCRRHGMRLVGPNCLGIADTFDEVRLNATFAAHPPLPGCVGVAVQSGGVGIALLERYGRLGVGVSSFVSLGDKYDVSGNDMLQWWESDPATRLAVLHLESFGNPRAFSRTARRVARTMPVLTVDAGRSEAGRRAAASHTAAAATPTMTRRALFTQAGIIATQSVAELVDTTALLHAQPLPAGARVAVVSNAGGAGVLAADACADAGLTVPALHPDLADELRALLPSGAATTNPVDTTAAVTADRMRSCLDRLAAIGTVDAVLVVLVPTALATGTREDPLLALTGAPGRRPRPVAAVLLDQEAPVRLLPTADDSPIPAYTEPRSAARALAHAVRYARWRAEPPGSVPPLSGIDRAGAAALVETFLSRHPGGGWLDPRDCAALLDRYRIPQLPWAWAEDEDTAVAAVRHLVEDERGRVAIKAYWPGLVHKSDQGALRLDLEGPDQVRHAYRELRTRFGDRMTGVLLQPMARRGIELFAGVVQDEVFGPLVLFGLGGTATELLADHAARLAPLTDRDVHSLLTAPRCAPLLFGYRGGGAVDLEGLEQLLLRLSRMACDLPQLAETDLNPVVARADGVVALDIRLRVLSRHAYDPYLRRLRAARRWRA
ncbi:bifunctional GNAT family N-acetyltransferase/acetate--CoA ligase family protein [Streptomyces sp. NBRC 110028]|uniref:bifunctional acetate--CoA ligase family protein/GNAT family N-acetyltransferase n=1 Tax=Streptomyces sp. NBRC 110028 TaxID=1621260 RepID=UPI0006E3CED1|nr:bifunctional GNAT family N-acetyltransferase/acetate--CoA ligase family protein [Streptomyces sp. NBRC 110028]